MTDKQRRRKGDLAPNPRMWQALKEGAGLNEILYDFYERVYKDPKLAYFFDDVTQERAIEKQYNFLMEVFTGERVYFGERPRNAHHWMVISNELFDYREELMESCLRRYGLPADLIKEWRAMEEIFRKQIVKSVAKPKKLHGMEVPLEGYESLELTAGSLCDGCQEEMPIGATCHYHVRTGRSYCENCSPDILQDTA